MHFMSLTFDKRIVSLDNVQKNNIVVSNLAEPLKETIFEQEYAQVARIVRRLISENEEINKRSSIEKSNPFYSGAGKQNEIHVQTVIPFIGERGTGKTSMMYSVWRRLKYYSNDPEAPFCLGKDDVKFVAFDIIDASVLNSKEDVLEIILSRMLSYLEKLERKSDDPYFVQDHPSVEHRLLAQRNENFPSGLYDFRELYRKIDSLHKDLRKIYWNEASGDEEPGLDSLKRVASSQQAISSFRELVFHFLQMVSLLENHGQDCYLVLALDDIDMYRGSDRGAGNDQFVLLEQIYDYMRIPGLIVFMTYNDSILKRNCTGHFYKAYFKENLVSQEQYSAAEQEEVDTLTWQFITKLLPPEQRIYLPDFNYIDSANRANLYIRPYLDGKPLPPFNERSGPKDEAPIFTVKEFMLQLIAYKTGVYYDMAGSKKHFFEPRNLRELGTLFQVINQLEDIPKLSDAKKRSEKMKLSEEAKDARARNRRALLNYFYNQFSTEHLSAEEYRQFHRLAMLPLVRQDRTLVDDICRHRMMVLDEEQTFEYLPNNERDRWKYSYGEVLHNIYFATRIPLRQEAAEPFYRSKPFIQCILGTHSILMNQTLHEPDGQKEMLEILGSSVAGRWANDMLPSFFRQEGQNAYWEEPGLIPRPASRLVERATYQAELGSVSFPVRSFFNWEIPVEIPKALKSLNQPAVGVDAKGIVVQFIKALLFIGMFFTGFPQNGLGIQLKKAAPKGDPKEKVDIDAEPILKENVQESTDNAEKWYMVSTAEDYICFNAFNFVVNLYTASSDNPSLQDQSNFALIGEKLIKLGEPLGSMLDLSSDQLDDFKGNWRSFVDAALQEYTQEVVQWQSKYEDFAFVLPVQHFDMMYNIIKRLASVSYHDISEEASVDQVYDHFKILYGSIRKELSAQDQVYFPDHKKGFTTAYTDSLFYKVFMAEEGKEPYYNKFLRDLFTNMMRIVLPAQDARDRARSLDSMF